MLYVSMVVRRVHSQLGMILLVTGSTRLESIDAAYSMVTPKRVESYNTAPFCALAHIAHRGIERNFLVVVVDVDVVAAVVVADVVVVVVVVVAVVVVVLVVALLLSLLLLLLLLLLLWVPSDKSADACYDRGSTVSPFFLNDEAP